MAGGAWLALGKAEGPLLTGASLSRKTRGSRWPGPGVPGTSKQDSPSLRATGREAGSHGRRNNMGPSECFGDREGLRGGAFLEWRLALS